MIWRVQKKIRGKWRTIALERRKEWAEEQVLLHREAYPEYKFRFIRF